MTTPILSGTNDQVIEEIVRSRALLALDFDGTLAAIVADRHAARLRPDTAVLLGTAAVLLPCAVVSGRSRADVAPRLPEAPLVAVVGSHGAEPAFGPVARALEQRVASWRRPLHGLERGSSPSPGLAPSRWEVLHAEPVVAFAVPTEVVVAQRRDG